MKTRILLLLIVTIFSCQKNKSSIKQEFTAINPLSYTDVKFCKEKNKVLASTYDGSIYKLNSNGKREFLMKIDDEIYGMQYFEPDDIVYLATYRSGVLVVDLTSKSIKKALLINNNAWLVNLNLSEDGRYLSGIDVKSNNHIWDIKNDYNSIDVSKKLPNNYIRFITVDGMAYFQTSGKYNVWDIDKENIIREIPIQGKLTDIDDQKNMVSLHENQFFFYDYNQNQITYSKKHPYFIYEEKNGDTLHDPYQLKLLDSKIVKDKIYTVGLDKSIRVWNKKTGDLIDEWVSNKATISGFDISEDKSQIVTVDLKGGIQFKNL